ncbi:MAG TPA: hypothetical protein PK771_11975, partial [Spirochaetota bacterium]|nr:hypothetical protein [Spirochaetota bacterium]
MKIFLFVILLLLLNLPIYSKGDIDISILMFNTGSFDQNNIDFLEKNVPEILINNIKKQNKEANIVFNLSWEKSKQYNDWKAKSEISAYEFGRILKSDFVIYGDIIQKENGFQIILNLFDIAKKLKITTIKMDSNENDIYSLVENLSKDLYIYIKKEFDDFIKKKIS